jgi:pimeloyl-ACP methyl ester carboxylesterase
MMELRTGNLYAQYYPGYKGTVLLVHGLLSSMGEFGDYPVKINEKGYAVLALDLEGHGKSGGKKGYESVEKNVENIKTWVDYLENRKMLKEPIIIIGHSLGAATTIYALASGIGDMGIAIAPPASIKMELKVHERLFLPLIYHFGTLWEKMSGRDFYIKYRVNYSSIYNNPEIAKRAENIGFLGDRLWIGSYPSLMKLDTLAQAKKVNKPCLVIVPDDDRVVNPMNGKMVYESLNGEKELYVAKGYGHSVMLEDRGDVIKKIIEFMERHRGEI